MKNRIYILTERTANKNVGNSLKGFSYQRLTTLIQSHLHLYSQSASFPKLNILTNHLVLDKSHCPNPIHFPLANRSFLETGQTLFDQYLPHFFPLGKSVFPRLLDSVYFNKPWLFKDPPVVSTGKNRFGYIMDMADCFVRLKFIPLIFSTIFSCRRSRDISLAPLEIPFAPRLIMFMNRKEYSFLFQYMGIIMIMPGKAVNYPGPYGYLHADSCHDLGKGELSWIKTMELALCFGIIAYIIWKNSRVPR